MVLCFSEADMHATSIRLPQKHLSVSVGMPVWRSEFSIQGYLMPHGIRIVLELR